MATEAKQNLKSLNNQTAPGDKQALGDAVFWSIEDVQIMVDEIRNRYQAEGLSEDFLPSPTKEEVAFRRALKKGAVEYNRAVRQNRGEDGEQYILRPVDEDAAAIVWAVVEEAKIGADDKNISAKTLEHATIDRIAFLKATCRVIYEKGHPLSMSVVSQYQTERGVLTSNDIQKLLRTTVDSLHAMPIRQHGGFYFIPAAYAETIRKLKRVVESLSTKCQVGLLTLYKGDADTQEALTIATSETLEAKLNAVKEELDSFSGDTSDTVLERRIAKLNELREQVDLYRALIGFADKELSAGIDKAEKQVMKMMGAA